MDRYIVVGLFFLFLFVFICGCNWRHNKPEGFPERLYSCEITVTQDGTPLKGAFVELFNQDENKKNWGTSGISDEKGKVKIYTYGKWKGAPEGLFNVTINLQEIEENGNKQITYSLIDEIFVKPETTPLKLEIKRKTKQTFDVGAPKKNIVKD
jgi:hypothetical protein